MRSSWRKLFFHFFCDSILLITFSALPRIFWLASSVAYLRFLSNELSAYALSESPFSFESSSLFILLLMAFSAESLIELILVSAESSI